MHRHPRSAARPTTIAVVALLLTGAVALGASPEPAAPPDPHWTYEGESGPEHWGALHPEWAACATGTSQAPIEVTDPAPADLVDPRFEWSAGFAAIVDTGHTVTVAPDVANRLLIEQREAGLLQFHIHAPGEHIVDGMRAAGEAHFVHQAADGSLSVVAVMLVEGEASAGPWQLYASLLAGATMGPQRVWLDWPALLPAQTTTIRYSGSLTTPPCTEGVEWLLMTEPVTLRSEDLARIQAAHEGNYRPVQPLNGREVTIDTSGG